MRFHRSYLVCATPRSGSTLLCEALSNTQIAGNPKEYFEALKKTGLPRQPEEYFETLGNADVIELLGKYSRRAAESESPKFWNGSSYIDYLKEVFEEGTTLNGVFGAKMMWGYLDDFIANLRQIPCFRTLPVADLLAAVFPNLQYIWVTRRDKIGQAVSLWKAIQTWTWKMDESQPSLDGASPQELTFHFEAIDHLVQQILAHEVGWQQFFEAYGIRPFTVVYEELAVEYEATTLNLLRYLQIPVPAHLPFAQRRMKKQADALSEEWSRRYADIKLSLAVADSKTLSY